MGIQTFEGAVFPREMPISLGIFTLEGAIFQGAKLPCDIMAALLQAGKSSPDPEQGVLSIDHRARADAYQIRLLPCQPAW